MEVTLAESLWLFASMAGTALLVTGIIIYMLSGKDAWVFNLWTTENRLKRKLAKLNLRILAIEQRASAKVEIERLKQSITERQKTLADKVFTHTQEFIDTK